MDDKKAVKYALVAIILAAISFIYATTITPGTGETVLSTNQTYYITSTGSDSNDCITYSTACATVQGAYNKIPALLNSDINISIGKGTYAGNIIFGGKSTTAKYKIILNGDRNIVKTGTITNGGTGTQTVQSYVYSSGLADYEGKIIEFTSGNNAGRYRVIDKNNATFINMSGVLFSSAFVNGDGYIIYDQVSNITGTITINPTSVITEFKLLNISNNAINIQRTTTIFNQSKINIGNWGNYNYFYIFDSSSIYFYENYLFNTGYFSGMQTFSSYIEMLNNLMKGEGVVGQVDFGLMNKNAYLRIGGGNVFKDYLSGYSAMWSDLEASTEMIWSGTTNNFIKNNSVGLYAANCGTIATNSIYGVTYIGNTANTGTDGKACSQVI